MVHIPTRPARKSQVYRCRWLDESIAHRGKIPTDAGDIAQFSGRTEDLTSMQEVLNGTDNRSVRSSARSSWMEIVQILGLMG